MNMDFHLKPASRQSQASGRVFQPGCRIVSYLCRGETGELVRADILEDEKETFAPPGAVLCRWGQTFKEREDPAAEARQTLRSAEDMFLSLYEEETGPQEESGDVLKYLLAVLLERKRILRPAELAAPGRPQTYRHRKSGREFAVPRPDLTAQSVLQIQEHLKKILF